ncbi:MAG: PQQ-binding-like beta-propeller repeat protein, partial [Pseudomonadota bacterium]|nr:PQQ-binding-like beta-propeller repeat protein [Pseudomonadota bacterium]
PRYLGPVVAGDRVYVVSRAGTVLGFDPDTGAQLDSAAVGTEILTPPQLAGGRMFLLGQSGSLIAVE